MSFDGTDDYVEIASQPELMPDQFTMEAWVKLSGSGFRPIFSKYNTSVRDVTFDFGFVNGKLQLTVYSGMSGWKETFSVNTTPTDNTWRHIAGTFNLSNNETKLYINGVEQATTQSGTISSIHKGSTPVCIGMHTIMSGAKRVYSGSIDELRFWNTVKTQAEIAACMNNPITGNESGLIAYYKFNDASTSNVQDHSTNQFHGTRKGTGGSNNLPQYSTDVPTLSNSTCGTPPPPPPPPPNTTRYVTTTGSGAKDGTDWANASDDLQAMINTSVAGDKIFVAKGTYKPEYKANALGGAKTPNHYDNAFVLKEGVKIYGGFAGTEANETERNYINSTNETILSGDFYNNDVITGTGSTLQLSGNGDNASHLILSIGSQASPITDATVLDGFTVTGGYANRTNYIAVNGYNVWAHSYGGMYNYYSSPVFKNMTFVGNYSSTQGGAIGNKNSSPTISYSTFIHNIGKNGGGAISRGPSSTTSSISHCTFIGNLASTVQAGAITGNSLAINHCTFVKNAVAVLQGPWRGGAVAVDANSKIHNSIFWKNEQAGDRTGAGADISSNTTTISNCLLQSAAADYSLSAASTGNVYQQDAALVDINNAAGPDGIHRTADDGLQLRCISPALNAGNNTPAGITPSTTDIIGAARINGTTVDMGAYEKIPVSPVTTQSATQLPVGEGLYTSTYTLTDGNMKHYCDCDNKLLLSLQDNANVADDKVSIKIGETKAKTYPANTGFITNPNGGTLINRSWDAIPATPLSAGTEVIVRHYFTGDEFTALNNAITGSITTNQLKLYKVTKAGAHLAVANIAPNEVIHLDHGSVASLNNWVHNTYNTDDHYAEFKVSSFSGGGLGGTVQGQPLPVELFYFTAKKQAENVLLTWATATEENNKGFHVQHSTNGRDFYNIGWIDGHGNSAEVQKYELTHLEPQAGMNYYRLKQMDDDGAFEYSHVVQVHFANGKGAIFVYPNPSDGLLNVDVSQLQGQKNLSISIYNTLGQEVEKRKVQSGTHHVLSIQNKELVGIHWIKIQDANGSVLLQEKIFFRGR